MQGNIKIMFLVVLLINYCVLIISIVKTLFCTEEKLLLMCLSNKFLVSKTIVKNNEKVF